MIILDENLIPNIEPSARPEGYSEQWAHPNACAFIKDGIVTHLIMLNPEDNLEENFKKQFDSDSWIYTKEAHDKGFTTAPVIGYTYDGLDFYKPEE